MNYLDANAGSRIRPAVSQAITELLSRYAELGNPASVHGAGRTARALLEDARERLAIFLGFSLSERHTIIFTSGGTESCNTVIAGFLPRARSAQIVTSTIEHPAMLEPIKRLAADGCSVEYCPVDQSGFVRTEDFVERVGKSTAVVSLIAANNETGAIQPVSAIASALRATGYQGAFVSDISQALWKSECSVPALFDAGVDAVAFSGEKLGTPAGIGAVVLKHDKERCSLFEPFLAGGAQEAGFRAGAPNLLGAISLGVVADTLREGAAAERSFLRALRDRLAERIVIEDARTSFTCGPAALSDRFVANTISLRAQDVRADDLVVALDLRGVSASSGAACASGMQRESHVIRALGLSTDAAKEVIRLSLDWDATEASIDQAAGIFLSCVASLRGVSNRASRLSSEDGEANAART